MEIIL